MGTFSKVIAALFFIALIWFLVRGLRRNPESFSKGNLSKSFHTMGVLALILIGVIWLAVTFLNHS